MIFLKLILSKFGGKFYKFGGKLEKIWRRIKKKLILRSSLSLFFPSLQVGGFCLLVELHREGSSIIRATLFSLKSAGTAKKGQSNLLALRFFHN